MTKSRRGRGRIFAPASLFSVFVCLPAVCVHAAQPAKHQAAPTFATDPQLPPGQTDQIPPGEMPQSARDWKYPHTKQTAKVSLIVGDQGGGPIRYNTRFPDVKGNPHPASYYHTAPFGGAEVEFSVPRGGVLLGGLARRDLWHRGLEGRTVLLSNEPWTVNQFQYSSSAFILGWVFGERYREAPWVADLSFVYDTATIKINMKPSSGDVESEGRARLIALSLRSRFQFLLMSRNRVSLHAGPEFHVPLYSSSTVDSDEKIYDLIEQNLKFKSSAAVGAHLVTGFRF